MYRGEFLFFLLAVGIFSIDFFKVRTGSFFDSSTLPPKITQWELDSCTRTISVQAVAGGIPPYDFYVFKQDPLDLSNWQVYRLIKEQLPQISSLPPGTYRIKAVNEGVTSPSFDTNTLEINFPSDPEIEVKGTSSLCSGSITAIALHLADSKVLVPIRWTAQVLLASEGGELLGYSSNPTTSLLEIRDTLINTGNTLAKVSYQLQALANGCLLPTRTVEVQVNPVPRIEATVSDSLICSGTPFSIALLLKSWGASPMQLRWSATLLSGQVIGLVQGEPSPLAVLSSITQTLVNRGTGPARIRYTFYPSFQGCDGIAESLELVLLPEPQVTQQADLISCAGEWVSVPEFNSNLPSDSLAYSWEVSDPSLGLSSGTGNRIPDFQAINSGPGSKRALIRVTPMLYSQGVSCTGSSFSFSISVRPPLVVKEELSNYAGFGISCAGAADGKIKLELSGGVLPGEEPSYRYSWTGPEGFVSTVANLESLQAGLYHLQVSTGMGNCLLEKSMLLTQPERLQISQSQVNNLCFQGNAGSLSIRVSRGNAPYSYAWTGPNNFSSSVANPQNLVSGNYQVTVTDANGCTITGASQMITEPSPLVLNQVKVDNSCFQGSTGNITVTASGGTVPYSYAWTGPNNFSSIVANPQNLVSGSYQVRVTDANGCTITGASQTISEPTPLALNQVKVDNSCFLGSTGNITVTASGGTAPYSYTWTGPNNFSSTVANPQNLVIGSYQVIVTDANGCTVTGATQTITEPSPLVLNQVKVDNVCALGAAGSITVTASRGTAPYSYAWTGPNNYSSTVSNPQNLVSGTYQVTVTDANGCSVTGATQTIAEPAQLTLAQTAINNSCFQGSTGSITATPSGGTAPYTYAWTGPNNFSSTVANPQNLIAGSYQVTVTDANGCILIGAQQTINAPTGLALTQNKVDNVCAQGATGSITITPTGGNGTYNFAWTGPNGFTSTNQNLSGLASGTYQVTVIDANGCTPLIGPQITITEPAPLTLAQSSVNTTCFQGSTGSITVTPSGGTAPYTYAWTGPNNFSSTVANPQNLVSGTYQVTVTDANGCSVTGAAQTITEPTALTITNQVKVDNVCAQGATGSITVTAAGGTAPYTYAWTGPNGFTSTVANPQNLVSGTYQVTVTDTNGCSVTGAQQIITEPIALAITQNKVDNVCAQGATGSITITPIGGNGTYSFAWTGPNGFISTNQNLSGLASGTYQVTVTDANGCTIIGAAQTITEPAALAITNQLKVDNVCAQGATGSITVTAAGGTGAYTYAWTGPNNFSSTVANPQNLVSGTYQVTITDANGCTITGAAQTITEPIALTITNQLKVENVCAQGATGSITVTAAGGTGTYTYAWTGPNNYSSTAANPENLVSGTYQVTITDANGCSVTGATQTIAEPAQLTLAQTAINNTCFQGSTGSITATPFGGTAPYTYAWTGPNNFSSTVANPQNLVSGTYQVTVTDANSCTVTGATQTITEPTPLAINAQVQGETCANTKDGRIELTPTGGTAPYQYSWDHGPTGPVVNGLGAGTYRVTLTDQNGCTQTAEYVLLPVPVLRLEGTVTYQATQVPLLIFAVLQSDAQGGTPPYTYRWSSGQTTPSITVTESGAYTLELQDAKGCVLEKEFAVDIPLPLAIDVDVSTIPLCEEQGQESTLRLSIQDGLPPYQITWSRGTASEGGLVLITRESGLFEMEVRDALGLVQKRTITILPRLTGPLDFEQLFESQTQFKANLVGFKGVFRPIATWPHQVISWDFGDGTRSSEASPTHTYTRKGRYNVTLTVLDESGCLITHSKVIDILDYFIEIPNVFTPNGDQLNDTFYPKFSFIPSLQLQVMNKWGELIYRSSGLEDAGWDGTVAGQKAPEGVYVYKLSYTVPDGRTFTSSSTFLLAR